MVDNNEIYTIRQRNLRGLVREIIETEEAMHTTKADITIYESMKRGITDTIIGIAGNIEANDNIEEVEDDIKVFCREELKTLEKKIYEAKRYYSECADELERLESEKNKAVRLLFELAH